jgi:RNA polymerase sigma-70 factor (ECF subfamily)
MTEALATKPLAPSELEELHARFRRPLLSYFMRRVGSLAEAEDLTQEVFFRLLRRGTGEAIAHKNGFIFAAAVNLLRDRARRDQARPAEAPEASATGPVDPALVEDCTPDRVLLGKERLAEVLACLDELPPRTRDIFLLFRVERMKQRDIATAMGVSVSAVEKHIMRASAHLTGRFAGAASGGDDDDA